MVSFFTHIPTKIKDISSNKEKSRVSSADDDMDGGDDEPPPLEMICSEDTEEADGKQYITDIVEDSKVSDFSDIDTTGYVTSLKYMEEIRYEDEPASDGMSIIISEEEWDDWYKNTLQFDPDEADEARDEKQMVDARSPINYITIMLLKG